MTTEQFLALVAEDSQIELEHDVLLPSPEALSLLNSGRPVPLEQYLSAPGNRHERRVSRYGHLLGPGLSDAEIDAWQERFPQHPLPRDLRAFLHRANGVRLWANLDTGWSYFRLLPLEEWCPAMTHPISYVFDNPLPHALCISDADDFAGLAILDTDEPAYWWCDSIDNPEKLGHTVDSLLSRWWEDCRLDPRDRPGIAG